MNLRRAALTALAMLAAAPAAALNPSQLIVFGDSLVDAGNVFLATGGFAPTNTFNNPSRGYFPGRFTNGLDYTDLLSQNLYGTLTTPSLAGGSNYAFGGARIVSNGDTIPDLAAQLGLYFAASGNTADANALYIINAGGNDVFGLQSGSIGLFPDAATYTTALLDTLSGSVQALAERGAGTILVTGIPNLTPTGIALDALVQARLDAIEPTLGGTDLRRFSYLSFFTRLSADPLSFGVPAFTQPGACFDNVSPPAPGVLPDCSGYFTVDGIHPIAQIQSAIFREVVQVAGVPEPATWALLIGGFAMTGTALRRRRALTV